MQSNKFKKHRGVTSKLYPFYQKLNYNCPDSEKIGSGPGSCKGDQSKSDIPTNNSKHTAYPGSKIERPILTHKTIILDDSETFKEEVTSELEFMKTGRRESPYDYRDPIMGKLSKESNYDGFPTVVTKEELNKIAGEGHRKLLRGVSDSKYAEIFRIGDYYPGRGVFGNGTYTAYGKDAPKVAQIFSGISHEGVVMEMALDKDARVIDSNDLLDIQKHMIMDVDSEIENETMRYYEEARKLFKMKSDDADKLYKEAKAKHDVIDAKLSIKKKILQDPGKAALINGYDAIDVTNEKYMVVLNRKALYVAKNDLQKEEMNDLVKKVENGESW